MNTQQDTNLNPTETTHEDNVIVWEKQLNPTSDKPASSAEKKPHKNAQTLRQKLLMTIVPTALLPLVIASAIGYSQTASQLEKQTLEKLEIENLTATEASAQVLENAASVPDLLAGSNLWINAIKATNKTVTEEGLSTKANDALERQFSSTKLVRPNAALNNELKRLVNNSETIVEAFITDKHGFNVAYGGLTSDFVQRDEGWWQIAKAKGKFISEPESDPFSNRNVIAVAKPINSAQGNMLGMVKVGIDAQELSKTIRRLVAPNLVGTEVVQVLDPTRAENHVFESISADQNESVEQRGAEAQSQDVVGGINILTAAKTIVAAQESDGGDLDLIQSKVSHVPGISNLTLSEREISGDQVLLASFKYGSRFYNLSVVPSTNLVTVSSVDQADTASLARNQLVLFAVTALILAGIAAAVISWLANGVSNPLSDLTATADQAAEGNLDVKATEDGTQETRALARTFNTLVSEVKSLLGQQEQVAQEQKDARDKLEMEIYQLLDEVGEAVDGDLTVRASLTSMEMSTVADLFNAIIDNLNDIAGQVQNSSGQVTSSLSANGEAIENLAQQAIQETERTRTTLASVEQMSDSIENVAANAGKAATISDEAYATVQAGSTAMDQTVESIVGLRNTVGDTAKKIKRLGESSQKISQVVSLIEEIALKTNLLAINASVEASRAGEQGQGFTVVAEQVGALAEQSSAATKEIAQIVAGIQAETKEVTEAMEIGTNQVVDTTQLVESTKDKLAQVLSRSQEINELMQSISDATVSQTETSKAVTMLMQQMAELAELRSQSSSEVAQSMQETATVAQTLEAAVAQFKVKGEATA